MVDPTENIPELEDQLAELIERREQLEAEICQGVALLVQNPSWNRLPLPLDILISILSHVIASDPRSIGRYLFVCRDWYSVIMSTPVLWSVISVVAPSEESKLASLTAYCRACIQRSCSAPLDITVDYRELCDIDTSSAKAILGKAGARKLKRIEFHIFVEDNVLARLPRTFGAKYLEQCAAPIQELVGPGGSEVARWRSFIFYAVESRNSSSFGYFRSVLNHSFSKQSIGSKKIDVFDFAHRMVYYRVPDPPKPQVAPSEAEKKDQEQSVLLEPLGIRELNVTCGSPGSFRSVLQFRRLVYLTIGVNSHRYINTLNKGDVHFPSLLTLNVQRGLPVSFWKHLDAPRLEAIRFHIIERGDYMPREVNILPSLHRIEFRCMHENLGSGRVAVFFPSCPGLHTIICFEERKEIFIRAVRELGAQAVLGSSLKQILLETWQGRIMSSPLRPTYELAGNETITDVKQIFAA